MYLAKKNICSRYDSWSTNSGIQEILCCLIFFQSSEIWLWAPFCQAAGEMPFHTLFGFPALKLCQKPVFLQYWSMRVSQSSTLIALDALCTNRLWSLLVQHLTSSVHTLSSGVRSKARSPNAWGSNKHKSQWLLSFSKFSGIFSFSLSVHLFFSFLPLKDLNSMEVILYQNQKRFIDIKICIYSLQ